MIESSFYNVAMGRQLPVPDIREDSLQYSLKQNYRREDSNRLRPPKLRRNHQYDASWNRSYSLQQNVNNSPLSSTWTTTTTTTAANISQSGPSATQALAISFRSDFTDSDINGKLNGDDSSMPVDNEGLGTTSTQSLNVLGAGYDPSLNLPYFEQCFTNLAKLGEGSFGEVFKVRNKDDGLLYAVKMSKQLFRSEKYRHERLEEVRRYEQLSGHDNCVRFYRAWEQDDRLFIQMELCRESLDQMLRRQRLLSEAQIWSILLDLSLALKSLHDRNLIHLDIKLDNVLIGFDRSCKLADFGLVVDVDKANRHQATEGDSRYIAPEIMRGQFSKAADIFSLGIAMFELTCCLELPANGPLWQELRNGILPDIFYERVPLQLQTVIRQMMSPYPELRPTIEQLLDHKIMIALMKQRKRYAFITQLRCHLDNMFRVIWSKLCNLKNSILCWYAKIKPSSLYKLDKDEPNMKKRKVSLFASTPCRWHHNDNIVPNNEYEHFVRLDALHLNNSTPTYKAQASGRSRKDLSKILLNSSYKNIDSEDHIEGTQFISLDEAENSSDVSLLRRKLFHDF